MAFCSNCGMPLGDEMSSCPRCGKALQSAGPAASSSTHPTELPLAENLAGALAYLLVPAVVFLLVEPYRRNFFVRFHSFQCLLTVAALILAQIAFWIVGATLHFIPFMGVFFVFLLWPLLWLASFVLLLLLVYKAYLHEIFKLPIVGDLAEQQASAS